MRVVPGHLRVPLLVAAVLAALVTLIISAGIGAGERVVYEAKQLPFTTAGLSGIPQRPYQSPRPGTVVWSESTARQIAELLVLELPAGVRELPSFFEPRPDPLETVCMSYTRYFAAADVEPLGVAIGQGAKRAGLGTFGFAMRQPSSVVPGFIGPSSREQRERFSIEVKWSPRQLSPKPDVPEPYLVWIRFKQTCV